MLKQFKFSCHNRTFKEMHTCHFLKEFLTLLHQFLLIPLQQFREWINHLLFLLLREWLSEKSYLIKPSSVSLHLKSIEMSIHIQKTILFIFKFLHQVVICEALKFHLQIFQSIQSFQTKFLLTTLLNWMIQQSQWPIILLQCSIPHNLEDPRQ